MSQEIDSIVLHARGQAADSWRRDRAAAKLPTDFESNQAALDAAEQEHKKTKRQLTMQKMNGTDSLTTGWIFGSIESWRGMKVGDVRSDYDFTKPLSFL